MKDLRQSGRRELSLWLANDESMYHAASRMARREIDPCAPPTQWCMECLVHRLCVELDLRPSLAQVEETAADFLDGYWS